MTVPEKLFREEAIRHRLKRTRAEVLLQRSTLLQPLLWMFCLGIFGLVLLINSIDYKETLTARGQLIADGGKQILPAPGAGIVSDIRVDLGDQVEEGEIVAILSQSRYDQQGQPLTLHEQKLLSVEYESAKQEKTLLQQTFYARKISFQRRINDQQARIETAIAGLGILEQRKNLSADLLFRTRSLLEKKSIPAMQVAQQELNHLALLHELNSAQSQIQELEIAFDASSLQLQALVSEHDLAMSRLDARLQTLSTRLTNNSELPFLAIMAQRRGVVSSIPVVTGEAVQQGQPLIYLQPSDGKLLVEIFVTSQVMGNLAPGQEVLLSYDAFDFHDYGRYTATIHSIDKSPLDSRQHLLPASPITESLFRVIASPGQHYVEGDDIFPLQPGLLLTADFVGTVMSLIRYILKPVLSLKGKVS